MTSDLMEVNHKATRACQVEVGLESYESESNKKKEKRKEITCSSLWAALSGTSLFLHINNVCMP